MLVSGDAVFSCKCWQFMRLLKVWLKCGNPDRQTASRLFSPLPTASLSAGALKKWRCYAIAHKLNRSWSVDERKIPNVTCPPPPPPLLRSLQSPKQSRNLICSWGGILQTNVSSHAPSTGLPQTHGKINDKICRHYINFGIALLLSDLFQLTVLLAAPPTTNDNDNTWRLFINMAHIRDAKANRSLCSILGVR